MPAAILAPPGAVMSRHFALSLVAFALVGPISVTSSDDPGATASTPRKDRHALLVGVTVYENLPASKHLKAPANDVLLVRGNTEDRRLRLDHVRLLSLRQHDSRRGQRANARSRPGERSGHSKSGDRPSRKRSAGARSQEASDQSRHRRAANPVQAGGKR